MFEISFNKSDVPKNSGVRKAMNQILLDDNRTEVFL